MRNTRAALRIVGGGLLFAIIVYSVLALPGLIDDRASTVPIQSTPSTAR